jgi:hypothetical protein
LCSRVFGACQLIQFNPRWLFLQRSSPHLCVPCDAGRKASNK